MKIRKVALLVVGNIIVGGEFVAHVDATAIFNPKRLEGVNYDDKGEPYVWDVSEAVVVKGDLRTTGQMDCHAWVLAAGEIGACGA